MIAGADKRQLVCEGGSQTWTRRYRLMVRTPGFHPGNRGSIPRSATNSSQYRVTRKGRYMLRAVPKKTPPNWVVFS